MTDTAERIAKLAVEWDREPNASDHTSWHDWANRQNIRRSLLAIATPGAQLGALVDLLRHARPNDAARMITAAAMSSNHLPFADFVERMTAALLAAMEEVEI